MKTLTDQLYPRRKYSTTVKHLRRRARAAEEAGDSAAANEAREAIAQLRENHGMKGRRRR